MNEWYTTPVGYLKSAFDDQERLTSLKFYSERVDTANVETDDVLARELKEYFSGTLRTFSVRLAPFETLVNGLFQQKVLSMLHTVPYGETLSYSYLAEKAGNKKAVRAAANTVAHNPIVILLACHRVIYADGRLGNYALNSLGESGEGIKKKLIEIERGDQ